MEHKEIHIEEDFWSDFTLEAYEHLDAIESNAMNLEQNPEDMELIHTMFRAFHTIKGLSGFVEHTVIQEVAHKTETLMDYCRKGELKVTTEIVNAILKTADFIRKMCDDVDCANDENLLNQIDEHIETLLVLSNQTETAVNNEQVVAEISSENQENQQENQAENFVENNNQENFEQGNEQGDEQNFEQNFDNNQDLSSGQSFEQNSEQNNSGEEFQQNNESEQNEIHQENQEESLAQQVFPLNPEEIIIPEEPEEETNSEENIEKQEIMSSMEENTQLDTTQVVEEFKPVVEEAKIENKTEIKVEIPKTMPKKIPANEEYMKVANHKIDHLVDTIGELIINQSLLEQYIGSNYSHDNRLMSNMSNFLRITRELQNLSMSLRLVSLKSTFQKVSRIARDTIQELNKDVLFTTSGENTEIDRVVTDKLLDPLVHMIKNAISHGVESNADEREAIGKQRKATVELKAYNKRGKIYIEISDDGKGIDTDAVYKKALEKGIIDPSKTYTDDEIKEFIMLPGFSTAKVVDNISGRGVGMDVVRTQVLKIGGKVVTRSEKGKGSTFTLEIPVNHAIMNGTIIEIGEQQFIIPTINVKEILQPDPSQWISTQNQRTLIKVREDIVPIVPLSMFLEEEGTKAEKNSSLVMLLELGQELRALPITNVVNRQEVVVKPVGEEFSNLKFISGMSILGTGKVSLILDVDYLFKKEVTE